MIRPLIPNKQTLLKELFTESFNKQNRQSLTSRRKYEMHLTDQKRTFPSRFYNRGRASVILDADSYKAKMSSLIENESYQRLSKDPTDLLTRKQSEKLLTPKRSGHLSKAVYNKIRPRHKQPPRICGLLKIHKADIPLRLVVSCANTFACDLPLIWLISCLH